MRQAESGEGRGGIEGRGGGLLKSRPLAKRFVPFCHGPFLERGSNIGRGAAVLQMIVKWVCGFGCRRAGFGDRVAAVVSFLFQASNQECIDGQRD